MSQLILAVPSKGRLEENAADIFARAGMPLKRAGARGYQGQLSGTDTVDVLYLSASEIAARRRRSGSKNSLCHRTPSSTNRSAI